MALIPSGSFEMGDHLDNRSDAQPVYTVALDAFMFFNACVLTVSICGPTMAADKKKKTPVAIKVPRGIELSVDQKAQLDALNKEFGPKLPTTFQKELR